MLAEPGARADQVGAGLPRALHLRGIGRALRLEGAEAAVEGDLARAGRGRGREHRREGRTGIRSQRRVAEVARRRGRREPRRPEVDRVAWPLLVDHHPDARGVAQRDARRRAARDGLAEAHGPAARGDHRPVVAGGERRLHGGQRAERLGGGHRRDEGAGQGRDGLGHAAARRRARDPGLGLRRRSRPGSRRSPTARSARRETTATAQKRAVGRAGAACCEPGNVTRPLSPAARCAGGRRTSLRVVACRTFAAMFQWSMRWQGQQLGVADAAALPGLEHLDGLVRSVTTPEFAGVTFHEVMCKSALNHVPGGVEDAVRLDGEPLSRLQSRVRVLLRARHARVPRPRRRARLRHPGGREGQRRRRARPRAAPRIVDAAAGDARNQHRPVPAGRGPLPADARHHHVADRLRHAVLDPDEGHAAAARPSPADGCRDAPCP